jgi:hypothetical protein
MRLRTVLTVAEALEASVNLGLRWRGGELPRILNAGHAAAGKPSTACYQSLKD